MTRDEIENMPAGREMDMLIAEKVMGWAWIDVPPDANGENAGRALVSVEKKLLIKRGDIDFPKLGLLSPGWGIKNYSTDIAAAWEVMEKMYKVNIGFQVIRWPPGGDDKDDWNILMGHGKRIEGANADTLPLAICRAALLTVLF